jgi:hypothetical protein
VAERQRDELSEWPPASRERPGLQCWAAKAVERECPRAAGEPCSRAQEPGTPDEEWPIR